MKYTFIIPTYNKKEFLKKSLTALNNFPGYGLGDYEVVVVDDGSTDDIFKAIKGVNKNYHLNYIYLERCNDSCRSRARNYGIDASRGKFIVFIDDDIVVTSTYLKELDRYYHFSDNLVILGTRLNYPTHLIEGVNINDVRKTACKDGNPNILEVRHLAFNRFSYNLNTFKFPWSMAFTSNLAVSRKLLQQVGGFDENFKKWGYEDVELGYRLFNSGAKFLVNTKMEVFHQSHPISTVGENNFDYFAAKCKKIFKYNNPTAIFSLLHLGANDTNWLTAFRKYPGIIRKKNILELRCNLEAEFIKKQISELSKKKGTEIIVNDYCENSDLDIWIQMLDINNAVISYFPQSLCIPENKFIELAFTSFYEKTPNMR